MSQPISSFHLSHAHAAALRGFALAAYPEECCGLLVGEGEAQIVVVDIVPTANIAQTPHKDFAIDPQQQFDALRATHGTARRVVGHYHSHPNGRATPSERDLAMAYDPAAIWVIVSIVEGRASWIGAFIRPANHGSFVEIPVTLLP